jgi:hypothetical protein
MFGTKYIPLNALLNLILLFNARAIIRLKTFTTIVATIASLNVNKYDFPTLESENKSI